MEPDLDPVSFLAQVIFRCLPLALAADPAAVQTRLTQLRADQPRFQELVMGKPAMALLGHEHEDRMHLLRTIGRCICLPTLQTGRGEGVGNRARCAACILAAALEGPQR